MVKLKQIFTAKNHPNFFFVTAVLHDSVCKIRMKKNDRYFPQIYLEECEYKEKKASKRHIKQKVIFPENDKSAESDGEYRPISS